MKTIKLEKIDENNILEYKYDEETNNVILIINFVESDNFKEHTLTTMTLDDYTSELDKIVKINKNNSAIALFQKRTYGVFDEYSLKDCYDLIDHSFSTIESLDIDYQKKFSKSKTDKYLVVKKKK